MVSHIVLQEVEHLLFNPLWVDLRLIRWQLKGASLEGISLLPEALDEGKNAIFAFKGRVRSNLGRAESKGHRMWQPTGLVLSHPIELGVA